MGGGSSAQELLSPAGTFETTNHNEVIPSEEKKHAFVKETLPLVFRFKDEEPLSKRKKNVKIKLKIIFMK